MGILSTCFGENNKGLNGFIIFKYILKSKVGIEDL